MVNATTEAVNATLSTSDMVTMFFTNEFIPTLKAIWFRFVDLVIAPAHYPEMIWIILPLVFTLIVMEFYFSRYRNEDLGWNTAVGNGVVLMFVCIDLLRQIYNDNFYDLLQITSISDAPLTTILAGVIGLWGLTLMFFDFFHLLPKKLAFIISSVLPVNLISYVGILLVYTNVAKQGFVIPIDMITLMAALLLLVLLFVLFRTVGVFIPTAHDAVEERVNRIRKVVEEEVKEENRSGKRLV